MRNEISRGTKKVGEMCKKVQERRLKCDGESRRERVDISSVFCWLIFHHVVRKIVVVGATYYVLC